MSIEDKRERIRALNAQIEARKIAHAVATDEANDSVREARLDREIERLESELAALDGVAAPTDALSAPEDRDGPIAINVADDTTKSALVEQAKALGITGASRMTQDQLIEAITAASVNNEGSEG